MNLFRDPAKRAEFVFGQPMKPCPKCGGYKLMYQTPLKMAEPVLATDSAKHVVGKWARATQRGDPLEGPVYIICQDCYHKGPAMDCTGMTREEVGRSREVSTTVKRLWNEQA